MVDCYIGLGSNLGNPRKTIEMAIHELDTIPQSHVAQQSSLYRTAPVGPQDQPDYINAVALLESTLVPQELLASLHEIEDQHGRIRGVEQWGPRTLDLDLLLYGNEIIVEENLNVPHREIRNRHFVLVPLHEIAPDLDIPGLGKVCELLPSVASAGIRKIN